MKILILSCNTGQGHNAAARAVQEEFLSRGDECEVKDALAFSSETTSKIISEGYIKMATDAPKVFGTIYQVGLKVSNPRVKSPVYYANATYARSLGRYIRENQIDAVLTSHVFPSEALTHLRKHGQISSRLYFILTDYTCHPFIEEIDADAYFIAHPDLTGEFVARGVERKKIVASGIPVSGRFLPDMTREEARNRLEIAQDVKVFLIMTGSMGFGSMAPVVKTILKGSCPNSVIYVMTGRNEEMKREIDAMHAEDARVVAVPFTTEVPLYMRASDVLLSKPGGLTTTEAAVVNIPLVHSAPIPGCETINAQFFEDHGMSVCAVNEQDSAHAALWLAADKEKAAAMMASQKRNINPRAAADICDYVTRECMEQTK